MAGCLDGIRVIDLGRYQAGPRCSLILADLGAEVIKVEAAPSGDESRRLGMVYWSQYNRGKKSITLNLRSERGKTILRELVRKSDMLLQNFSPGVMDAMGLGYDALKALNPGLIMINVSGFGQYGPYRSRRAFDPIGQAMAGVMFDTGSEEGPPVRCGPPIIDRITALHATIGALGALHRRDVTGSGQSLDVSLLDSAFTLMEIPIAQYLTSGKEPKRNGNRAGALAPSNTYRARDGWVYIIAVQQKMWERFCHAAGREDLVKDARASSVHNRASNTDWVDEQVAAWVRERTVAEVVEILAPAGVPVAPVQTIPQAANDPHLWERQMLVETEDRKGGKTFVAGLTVKFSETPGAVGPIPEPGEHNQEIFGELLGHTPAEIEAWRSEGVI
ncbi:MAG TPA: CoA transferase [Candidatus Binataceae bacterium]|nr:CoA transferase [Candidatus Binataceae bacterium]